MKYVYQLTPQAALNLLELQTGTSSRERPIRRSFSPAFKQSVCRDVALGAKRPSEICRQYLLKEAVLRRWSVAYQLFGDSAFAPRKEAS